MRITRASNNLADFLAGILRVPRIYSPRTKVLRFDISPSETKLRQTRREGPPRQELYPHLGHAYEVSFALILHVAAAHVCDRLRRAVLHPKLVISTEDQRAATPAGIDIIEVEDLLQQFTKEEDKDEKPNVFAEKFLENLTKDDVEECPICFSEMENPVVIPECMHQLYVFLRKQSLSASE